MPIVDVQVVTADTASVPAGTAKALVDAVATALRAGPGRVWLRLELLDATRYAENESSEQILPVFVRVLHADLPSPEALGIQALALAQAVAASVNCAPEHVHIEYAQPGRGRVAFGGHLLPPMGRSSTA